MIEENLDVGRIEVNCLRCGKDLGDRDYSFADFPVCEDCYRWMLNLFFDSSTLPKPAVKDIIDNHIEFLKNANRLFIEALAVMSENSDDSPLEISDREVWQWLKSQS